MADFLIRIEKVGPIYPQMTATVLSFYKDVYKFY